MGKVATEEDLLKLKRSVNVIEAYLTGILTDPNDWAEIKAAVEAGYGSQLYPIGYEFTIPHQFMGDSIWVVRGHDYDPLGTELPEGKHNMLIEMKYAYGEAGKAYTAIQFDAKEAFYYAETGLAAGTYTFHVAEAYSSWTTGDYQFTLASNVQAGSQLVFSGNAGTALTAQNVQVYSSGASTTVAQTAVITSGNGGTSLGSIGVSNTNCDAGFNSLNRASYGSNNYAQSAIRQWLNSDASSGSVWEQQTMFDRIPSWGTSSSVAYQGFQKGFSDDFLRAIRVQGLPWRTNSVFEHGFELSHVYQITDAFFLLSRPEVYGTYDSTAVPDGTVLGYYDGMANLDRILYDNNGVARSKWLRSPSPGVGHNARNVNTQTGEVNHNSAFNAYGAAPACLIG